MVRPLEMSGFIAWYLLLISANAPVKETSRMQAVSLLQAWKNRKKVLKADKEIKFIGLEHHPQKMRFQTEGRYWPD